MRVKRVLISLSDKTGILEFARRLHKLGVEIISTGGTAKMLREAGLPVVSVSSVTGFPEIMDGRVKTLHPKVHGGILGRRDNPEHMRQAKELGIEPIDMVVVNLYPFKQTIAKPNVTLEEAIENIDIGGPSMVRSAAKNHRDVIILVNPARYEEIITQLETSGDIDYTTRLNLAAEAFRHTSEYDALIQDYLFRQAGKTPETFPDQLTLNYSKKQELRYGENPHQQAAFYSEIGYRGVSVANAVQLHGKELSYNNINDLDAALRIILEFSEPAVTIIKHTNPCGTACGKTIEEAYRRAWDADPVSAFGGIIAFNRHVTVEIAREITKVFVEALIAPGFSEEALELLKTKKNLILLATGDFTPDVNPEIDLKKVAGGLLVQTKDTGMVKPEELQVVTKRQPTVQEMADLMFAWKVVKHVKSNAIVLAKDGQTLGVGAGQMNRVGAAKIAIEQAGEKAKGAALASDAFFPFGDTVKQAAEAGVTAIIQPGGSIRDAESIAEADAKGIAMVFTGIRHFKH